jgi:hypothetical protein
MSTTFTGPRTKKDLIRSAPGACVIKTARKIGNNTLRYQLTDGSWCIQLHDTVIVRQYPDGDVELNSGGWQTVTTKSRMNEYMDIPGMSVWQTKGQWFVGNWNGTSVPYHDGILVKPDGTIVGQDDAEAQAQQESELLKKIQKFMRAMSKHIDKHGIPLPNNGDCWFCLMKETSTGKPLGDCGGGDTEHLLSHVEERYIHGSLIVNALEWAGYQNPGLIIQMKLKTSIMSAVRRYLKRKLGLPS